MQQQKQIIKMIIIFILLFWSTALVFQLEFHHSVELYVHRILLIKKRVTIAMIHYSGSHNNSVS
jgi:hypothetical protein